MGKMKKERIDIEVGNLIKKQNITQKKISFVSSLALLK